MGPSCQVLALVKTMILRKKCRMACFQLHEKHRQIEYAEGSQIETLSFLPIQPMLPIETRQQFGGWVILERMTISNFFFPDF